MAQDGDRKGIVKQGEGARGVTSDSHYGKFLAFQEAYEQILKEDPDFEAGQPVLWNPYSMWPGDLNEAAAVNLIDDSLSIDVSNLFDGC